MQTRIRPLLLTAFLLAAFSPLASAGQPASDRDPIEPHMERLSELLDRLPGELAHASERMRIMTDRLMALLPDDAEMNAALTQFRLFLDGLYLRFSGETAPIPGYREVREQVIEGLENNEAPSNDAIET